MLGFCSGDLRYSILSVPSKNRSSDEGSRIAAISLGTQSFGGWRRPRNMPMTKYADTSTNSTANAAWP